VAFSRRGVVVRSAGLSLSLGLRGYGYGDRLTPVGQASPIAHANQVLYGRRDVREWYANGPLGLEQGFTLARPPSRARTGLLTLSVGSIPTGVRASPTESGRGVTFTRAGRTLLRYTGLFASDARGRALPAHVELAGNLLLLRVDDRGARYPLRVDPYVQAGELTASDGGAGDELGQGDYGSGVVLSTDGLTIAAEAYRHTVGANVKQGAVYVFVRPASGWADATQTAELTESDGTANDELGGNSGGGADNELAISANGSTIAIGAAGRTVGGNTEQGAIYVFVRPASGWVDATQNAELTASDGAKHDQLGGMYYGGGVAISADGSTIAAGSPQHAVGGNVAQGAVYVFTRPVSGWVGATQTAELTASDGAAIDELGQGDHGFGAGAALSADGSTIVAAADIHKVGSNERQGALYVFTRPASGWVNATQTAELTASDGAAHDELGYGYYDAAFTMSPDGSTIIAAAPWHTVGANAGQGAIYVFVRPVSGWANATQTAELTASDGAAYDHLGSAYYGGGLVLSADGSTIAAAVSEGGPESNRGALYVFARPASGWANTTQTAELTASDRAATGDYLAWAGYGGDLGLSADGSTLAVAAPEHSVGSNAHQGALYLFARPASGWADATETAELTACDGAEGDYLAGAAISADGGTIAAFVVSGDRFAHEGEEERGKLYVFAGGTQQRPCAITLPATSITATGATLNGRVNPEGSDTSYEFEYGPTASYGSKTPATDAGSGSALDSVSAAVSGLSTETTYHFRVLATNAAGTSFGRDQTFTTSRPFPQVVTGPPAGVLPESATLTGSVNPEGVGTTYFFEWGATAAYGVSTPTVSAGSGTSAVPVSALLTGLSQGSTYHYRLVAVNSAGTSYGQDVSFMTPVPGPPVVATGEASGVGSSEATLNGTVTPSGYVLSDCHFEYGVGGFSQRAPCAGSVGAGFEPVGVSAHLSGLPSGRTYEFRLSATNALGGALGATKTFVTCAATRVTFGVVDARGCFVHGANGAWSADATTRINGIDFAPNPGGTVELDPKGSGFSVTGSGTITVGGILPLRMWSGPVSFEVPPSGALDNFAMLPKLLGVPFGADVPFDVTLKVGGEATISSGSLTAQILGNTITASASVTTSNDYPLAGAEVSASPAGAAPGVHELSSCSFSKPAPTGYTCATVTNAKGNTYSGLVASEPQIAKIGGWLPVKDLSLSYDHAGGGVWHAQAALAVGDILPGPLGGAFPTLGLGASFQVNPFSFIGASFADEDLGWHLGPVTIKEIGVGFALKPALSVSGKAGLEAGSPQAPVGINAGFSYTHGVKSGFDVALNGGWTVEGVGVSGHVELDTREAGFKVLAGGSFTREFGPVSATLGISGGVDNHGDYQFTGNGNISAFGANIGAHGVLSNTGVGACGELHILFFDGEVGFKHFWSGETDFNGCEFSGLYTLGNTGTSSSVTTGHSVHFPAGLKREEFAAVGANSAPAVTVISPDGKRLETPGQPDKITVTKQGLALAVSSSHTTYFIVQHPAGGTWRLEPRPGNPAPVRYEQANPLLPLRVSAHVTGRGTTRTLSWRFRPQPGESVRFVEEGPHTEHAITTTTRGHGSLRFHVAPGPASPRHITAYINIEGFLRQHLTIASLKAPATALRRVSHASYRQHHNTITVTWRRLAGASYYELTLALKQGTLRYRIPGTQAHVAITLPPGSQLKRVTITITTTHGLTGPTTTAHKHH
jgi:hypothetical protein